MGPFKMLYKNTSNIVKSLPNCFLHYSQVLELANLYQQHITNHITTLNNSLSTGDNFSRIIQHRLFQIAEDFNLPFSPLLLKRFDAFTKTNIMNTNLVLRIIFHASKIGVSFATTTLQASRSVNNNTYIFTLFENNSGLYSSSLHMIKRSNIKTLNQCTSADGTVLLQYRDAFKRNSQAHSGGRMSNWYNHLVFNTCHANSFHLKDEFIQQSPRDSTSLNTLLFPRFPVPERNIRAASWCSTWNELTQSPIIGKAIYTYPSGVHF